MLQVTPCSKEEAGKYNIQLVTAESEYPADIHCHSVLERTNNNIWVLYSHFSCSWLGRPEYREDKADVLWGGSTLFDDSIYTLVVYYDIRDIK